MGSTHSVGGMEPASPHCGSLRQELGGAGSTSKEVGEQSAAEPGPGSSGGSHGEALPSVSDWYSIFQRWNVCFVGLFPWLHSIY